MTRRRRTRTALGLGGGSLTLLLVGCGSGPPSVPIAAQARGASVLVTCAVECGESPAEAVVWAEEAAGIAADLFGVELQDIGRMHLARDVEEYEALEEQATGGRLRSNLALSKPEWQMSVVAIQPPVDARALALTGLPMQTLRLVAHEASHLVSYTAMPPPRRAVPGWLEEGVAILVETETRSRMGLLPEQVGEDPLLSTYLLRVAEAEAEGRMPGLSDLLEDRNGDLSGGEVYAVRALLMLSLDDTDRDDLRSAIQATRTAFRDGEGSRGMSDAFVTAFGGLERIEESFDAWRARQQPMWREGGRSLSAAGRSWVQHAFPGSSAHAIRTSDSGERWEFTARVRVGGDDPVAAITLAAGQTTPAFVRVTPTEVALVRNDPREVILRVDRPGADGSEADAAIRVEMLVDRDLVTVRSDAGELGSARLGVPVDGPWGLLVQGGAWAVWEDVSFSRRSP